MNVRVAANGLPGLPGDPKDDDRDRESDQWIGNRYSERHSRRRDHGEADVAIGSGVSAVSALVVAALRFYDRGALHAAAHKAGRRAPPCNVFIGRPLLLAAMPSASCLDSIAPIT